jgi:lysophospholipase L1-like esterase
MNGKSRLIHGGLLALAIVTGVRAGGWNGGVRAVDRDSVTLRKLVTAYFDGVATKSFVELDSVVTRDFLIYEDGKVWNNDSVFHNIQYNQPFTVRFTLTNFQIFTDTRSGEVRYHSQADFVVADTVKFTLNFLETALCRRTAAGWKISLIHVTGEKPPGVYMPRYYQKYDTPRYIPEHYRERMEAFREEVMHRGGIVMLGNSITEFGDWKRLFGDSGVINRGIAGDNTFGMLERLSDVIARRPAKLFIEAGVNDIGQGVPVGMIVGNIISIVQYVRVKSPGTRVYVVSVLPTNDRAREVYPEVAGKNEVVREVDGRLMEAGLRGGSGSGGGGGRGTGVGSAGFVYIDLAARVTDGSGNLDERYAKPDGLHLNEAGYGVLMGLLKGKGPVR